MVDEAKMQEWAADCEKWGCPPGFVAATLSSLDSFTISVQMDLELAKVMISQGDLVGCELVLHEDNPLFRVLLSPRHVRRDPGDSDEEYNGFLANSFGVLKEQLPEHHRILVETTVPYEIVPPLGCPQILISSYR